MIKSHAAVVFYQMFYRLLCRYEMFSFHGVNRRTVFCFLFQFLFIFKQRKKEQYTFWLVTPVEWECLTPAFRWTLKFAQDDGYKFTTPRELYGNLKCTEKKTESEKKFFVHLKKAYENKGWWVFSRFSLATSKKLSICKSWINNKFNLNF